MLDNAEKLADYPELLFRGFDGFWAVNDGIHGELSLAA